MRATTTSSTSLSNIRAGPTTAASICSRVSRGVRYWLSFSASGNPLPDVEPLEPLAPKAFELKQPDQVYGKPIATASGALVLQLKERTEVKHEDFVKEKSKAVQALLQAKSSEALARYLADLRRAAGDKLKVMSEYGDEAKGRADEE